MTKKVAVILSGCGFLDGAEIRESVLTLLSLDSLDIEYDIFAPNKVQHHTVNHLSSEEQGESRNIMVEAARIARGNITALDELNPDNYDALVIPGGFGVAKNLCTFAFDGVNATVDETVKTVITSTHAAKKPIVAICIAPALVALTIKGCELTIGSCIDTAAALESLGAKHKITTSAEFVVDDTNKVITTAAYMHDTAKLDEIHKGIFGALEAMKSLI